MSTLKIAVDWTRAPRSQGRVVVRCGAWQHDFTIDNSNKEISVVLPDDVLHSDVEAYIEYLDNGGRIDTNHGPTVLKTKARTKLPARKTP